MIGRDNDDTWYRGKVLINLRHGIRQSSRLAEELAEDAIVGSEALDLLGRLKAIGAELDDLASSNPDVRRGQDDPVWDQPPHPFLKGAARHTGI